MLQHEERFHDDVKLVLVYSFILRAMLKNLQRSPIGKGSFPALMKSGFSWYSQVRQKELLFCETLPKLREFVAEHLTITEEFENEMIDSIAEITFYILTHAQDNNLHETISMITNPSYRKCMLKKAWDAGLNEKLTFEDWYKDNYSR